MFDVTISIFSYACRFTSSFRFPSATQVNVTVAVQQRAARHATLQEAWCDRQGQRLSKGRWRKQLGVEMLGAQERLWESRAGIPEIRTALSRTFTVSEYLAEYFRGFREIQSEYAQICYRNQRFRRYSISQRAYDGIINELVLNHPPRPPPKKSDRRRKRDARKARVSRRRRRRAHYAADANLSSPTSPSPSSPLRPPVIAFGDGFCGHSKRHPPLPIRSLIYRISRHALVVITPEYCTSKLTECCHVVGKSVQMQRMRCKCK